MNTPPDFGQKIAQHPQQKLVLNYEDLLPQVISAGVDVSSIKSLDVDHLAVLGKQSGVRFLVRGGLLTLS